MTDRVRQLLEHFSYNKHEFLTHWSKASDVVEGVSRSKVTMDIRET